jgi:hypothetical protein
MRFIIHYLIFFVFASFVWAQSFTLEVSGDAETAPIYVLEGSATSQFVVDGDISVDQALTYSTDSVALGAVATTGRLTITRAAYSIPYFWGGWMYELYRPGWDATFNADSNYSLRNYGRLIVASFNHRLNSPANESQFIDDATCSFARISSKGRMILVSEGDAGFRFDGLMAGVVQGFNDQGRRIRNFPYRVFFTQSITGNFDVSEWGAWLATYQVEQSGRRITGSGVLEVGPEGDPVDIVPQNLRGSYNGKRGVFSWGAAGSDSDRRVTVKITHNDEDELVQGKNHIKAAGQSRKF